MSLQLPSFTFVHGDYLFCLLYISWLLLHSCSICVKDQNRCISLQKYFLSFITTTSIFSLALRPPFNSLAASVVVRNCGYLFYSLVLDKSKNKQNKHGGLTNVYFRRLFKSLWIKASAK